MALPTLMDETFLPGSGSRSKQVYVAPLYDSLIYADHKTGAHLPGLATRWETSADAKVHTFWLRQGTQFHDGWGEVTAVDVKFSLDMMLDPVVNPSEKAWYTRTIEKVEVVNPYQVIVYTKGPNPVMLVEFSTGSRHVPIASKRYVEAVGAAVADKKPIGSGAYKFVENRLGDYIKYEAVEDHWAVVPEFKYLVFRKVPEEATRLATLLAGEVDISVLSAPMADSVKKAGLQVLAAEKSYASYIPMGGLRGPEAKFYDPKNPFLDKRVRQALSLAINRDEIAQFFYKGFATPIATDVIWGVPGVENLKPDPYDPKRARQLLADAGYPNGFETTLSNWPVSPGAELPALAEVIAASWGAIGVKTKLMRTELATFLPRLQNGDYTGQTYIHRTMNAGDPSVLFESRYPSKRAGGGVFFDKQLDVLLDELYITSDVNARARLSLQIVQLLYNEYAVIPVVSVAEVYGLSNRLDKNSWQFREGAITFAAYWEWIKQSPPLGTFRLFTP